MFFDYSLLNRRNGKFSLIWLVVNDRLEYRKRTDKNFREIMAIDVPRTCEDIMRYVCLEVPASGPRHSRPRFSLYLSSMLMAGCARIHRHQTAFLLMDVGTAFEKLMKTPYIENCLDGEPTSVRKVTLTVDPLALVPSGDPFQLGALYDINSMLDLAPELPAAEPAPAPAPAAGQEPAQGRQRRAEPETRHLAAPSDITLREVERGFQDPLLNLLEDFGDPLPPHLRELGPGGLFQDVLLAPEPELTRAVAPPAEPAPPAPPNQELPLPPPMEPLPPPTAAEQVPVGAEPGRAAAALARSDTTAGARAAAALARSDTTAGARAAADSFKSSMPAEPLRVDRTANESAGAAATAGDGVHVLGDELAAAPDGAGPAPAQKLDGPEQPPPPPAPQPPPPPAPERAGEGRRARARPGQPREGGEGQTQSQLPELALEAPPQHPIQAEVEATPVVAGEPTRAPLRPQRPVAPPAADVTLEESAAAAAATQHSSLTLPADVAAPRPAARRRRRLAVDQVIQLDREAIRRRIQDCPSDTMRGISAIEDSACPPSQRWVPAQELLSGMGRRRPAAGALAALHRRHHRTRPEQDWPWTRAGLRQEPVGPAARQERAAQEQEPEVARDRTATTGSGTGSLLAVSRERAARLSGSTHQSLASTTPGANLQTIHEERTPAAAAAVAAALAEVLPPPPGPSIQAETTDATLPPPPPPIVAPEQQLPAIVLPEEMPPPLPQPEALQPPQPEALQPPQPEALQPPQPEALQPPQPATSAQPPPDVSAQDPSLLDPNVSDPSRAGQPAATAAPVSSPEEQGYPTSAILSGSNSFRSASVVPEDLAERLRSAGAQRMTFRQLVTSSRLQAAASFSHLLQLHKQRKLRLQQQVAYGPLYICCVDE